jgi:hypothetical protein
MKAVKEPEDAYKQKKQQYHNQIYDYGTAV